MAQSENVKKLHETQVAFAKEQFDAYKNYIVNEFVNEFGGSYQTPEQMKGIWRQTFTYEPECENFLEFKTRIFIRMLPNKEDITNNPKFLRNFIRLVSDYLSVYIVRKTQNGNRNECANELYERLYSSYVKRVANRYQKQKNLEWGLKQKAIREAKQARQKQKVERTGKRKRIAPVPVVFQQKQIEKLGTKSVRARVRLAKQEIAQFEISIRAVKVK